MSKRQNTRAIGAKICWQVIDKGRSLDASLADQFGEAPSNDRGLIQELVYGCCRWYGELDAIAAKLLEKPIREKDRIVHFILLIGLYQLQYLKTADHAAISETVTACQQLNKSWAKNLINGCLRRWQRESKLLQPDEKLRHERNHPSWLVSEIKRSWPQQAEQILAANDERPPMILRVNQRRKSRSAYLQELAMLGISAEADIRSSNAIRLHRGAPVSQLPGFGQGDVSVQDIAAQIAADILQPQKGDTVLDACAAPGGKAAHLLERCDNRLKLDALDISEPRVVRLRETFERLRLDANVFVADATNTQSWPVPMDGYDHILVDAPCSGTGVISRHPDIKHHRRQADIATLNTTQGELLSRLWEILKPGGQMLYMTCSILPSENEQQIEAFLLTRSDIIVRPINHPQAFALKHGHQSLPGIHNMDGFYTCLMIKGEE